MKKKASEVFKVFIFIAIGILLAWWALRNMAFNDFLTNLKLMNPYLLGLSLLIGLFSHYIRAMRWNMLLKPSGHYIRPVNSFMAVIAGYFINLAVPRAGELARCGLVSRYDKVPMSTAVGTVAAERVVDMILLLLFFAFNFIIGYNELQLYVQENIVDPLLAKFSPMFLLVAAVTAILVAGALFMFFRRRNKKQEGKKGLIEGFIEGLKSVGQLKNPFGFIAASLGIWACYYFMLYIGMQAHPATQNLSWEASMSVFTIGTVGMVATPAGVGYVGLVGQILFLYGIPLDAGRSFGLIIWGGQTIMLILLGPLSLIGFPILNRQNISTNEGTVTP